MYGGGEKLMTLTTEFNVISQPKAEKSLWRSLQTTYSGISRSLLAFARNDMVE
jgi:hypothetical protein